MRPLVTRRPSESVGLPGTSRDVGIGALDVESERTRAVRVVKVTLAVGVVLIAAVCAYALTRSPPRVLRAGPRATELLGGTDRDGQACQAGEVLPADVSAIRLSLAAFFGAPVRLRAFSGSTLLTEGTRGPEWTGTSVTVRVKPLKRAVSNVTLCFDIAPNSESIYLFGRATSPREAMTLPTGGPLAGRLDVEYLASGRGSWWSRVLSVARHMGLGRAFSGTWIVMLITAMVAAVGALAMRLTLRDLS